VRLKKSEGIVAARTLFKKYITTMPNCRKLYLKMIDIECMKGVINTFRSRIIRKLYKTVCLKYSRDDVGEQI